MGRRYSDDDDDFLLEFCDLSRKQLAFVMDRSLSSIASRFTHLIASGRAIEYAEKMRSKAVDHDGYEFWQAKIDLWRKGRQNG